MLPLPINRITFRNFLKGCKDGRESDIHSFNRTISAGPPGVAQLFQLHAFACVAQVQLAC